MVKRFVICRVGICAIALGVAFTCGVAPTRAGSGIPDNILSEFKYLVGTWEFGGKIADEQFAGTVSYKWATTNDKVKNHYGLVANWTYEIDGEPVTSVGILGWNSAKECIVECSFGSDGSAILTDYTVKSSSEWRGEFSDVKGGAEVTGKGEVTKQGPDKFVYEGKATTGSSAKLVFEKK